MNSSVILHQTLPIMLSAAIDSPTMHEISHQGLSLQQIENIIDGKKSLGLSEDSRERIERGRSYLDEMVAKSDDPIYGINTGFGALCNTKISRDNLEKLQSNLVMSHAVGTGQRVPSDLVKLMLLLKIQALSHGNSGVSLELVERLIWHYNNDILPIVYDQGSLGASGDLAPLAHLALPLIGQGEVSTPEGEMSAEVVLSAAGLVPLQLRSKEGLALLNGTQFMAAYGVELCLQGKKLVDWANWIASLSLEAFDGRRDAFAEEVHQLRRQKGQVAVAKAINRIMAGSSRFSADKEHVQDPYSFRCIPQVHGASLDALNYVHDVFEREVNAVTDNPTILFESDAIVSAGNFHGQPLALALDFYSIAIAEMGSISERRVYKLLSGERGLPPFLVANPGLHSGFMIPQYTAASIVSRNKQLCTPCSVDTIDSSNGQEDHVSMGANAAVKSRQVLNNVYTVLAIELINAAQALDFRGHEGIAPALKRLHESFRGHVDFVAEDRPLYEDIRSAEAFIRRHSPGQWLL